MWWTRSDKLRISRLEHFQGTSGTPRRIYYEVVINCFILYPKLKKKQQQLTKNQCSSYDFVKWISCCVFWIRFFKRNFEKKSCFLSEQTFHDNLFKILFYTNFIFCSSLLLLLLLFLLFFGFLWMLNTCKYLNLFHFRFCCCYFRMV